MLGGERGHGQLSKKAYSIGKRVVFSMWRYAVRGAHNILF
jgi:hypothetical protein